MVHGEKYLNSCSALTWSIEYHCWQGVEDLVRQIRMEATPSNLSQSQPTAGASFNRSVCKQATSSTDNICQLEATSFSYSHRCLHTGLVHNAGQVICQPTLEHDRQSSIPSTPTECPRVGPCGTSPESSSLVPNSITDVGQSVTSDSPISRDNIIGASEQPSRHHSSTSHIGYIRERCHHNQLSKPAADLILSPWRDKSSKSYNSSFGKWVCWYNQWGRNPISGPISDITNQRFYHKPCNSNPVCTAVLFTGSTDSLQNARWYVIQAFQNVITWMARITRVITSYSGLHEKCEVNISTSHPTPIYCVTIDTQGQRPL